MSEHALHFVISRGLLLGWQGGNSMVLAFLAFFWQKFKSVNFFLRHSVVPELSENLSLR